MRYIDADAFKQKLADKDIFFPALYKNELDEMPTADVVPKREVEELIKSVDDMLDLVCTMTGLELTYYGKYAEFKKKYTEERE